MCINCDWENLTDEIENMLISNDYEQARPTLTLILNAVRENGHATRQQRNAVTQIKNAWL